MIIHKKMKSFISLLLAFVMAFSMMPAVYAAGTKQSFPLMSATGQLVADQNTKYVTTFVQDPVTKLITASVEVQNNTATGANIVVNGVGLEISFTDKIAPYEYDPTNLADPHPYDATRLYIGAANTSVATLRKYSHTPIETFNTLGTSVISNNGTKRMVGAKLSAGSDSGVLYIPANGSKTIAQFFFMPANGTDILNLDMFSYHWEVSGLNKISTWIGNGTRLVVSNELFPSAAYLYVHSPETFKIHVKHGDPTGLSANPDNKIREIVGYDNDTMEWAVDEAGPYTPGQPSISEDAQTVYVRVKGSDYTGADSEYGNYKKYIPSNAVAVVFNDAFFAADTYADKVSKNLTATDNKNHVGDTIRYTITAGNNGDARSEWTDVLVTDQLPAGVTFVENSVKIDGVTAAYSYEEATRTLKVSLGNIAGQGKKELTFDVTVDGDAHGKDITNSATVSGKDGENGEDIEKPITDPDGGGNVVEKSSTPDIDPITEGDKEVTGTGKPGATIEVTFPDDTKKEVVVDEDGNWTVAVPDDIDLVEGNKVTAVQKESGKEPSDPKEQTVVGRPNVVPNSTKTSKNTSRADGTNHVGDTFEYTITVRNDGTAKSLWKNVVVTDELPAEIDFMANSVEIDGVPAGLDAIYSSDSRTLTVFLGNIAGGSEKVITFSTTINESAYGKEFKNTAAIKGNGGEEEIEEPEEPNKVVDKTANPTINQVTEGDKVVTGTGVAGAEIIVNFPGGITASVTVDSDNTWKANVPEGVELKKGNEITAIQTETDKESSDTVKTTVVGRPSIGGEDNILLEKDSKNTSRDDGTTRVGDTIEYTVTASNQGAEKSLWADAVMTDELPAGVSLVSNSVKINGTPAPAMYDHSTRVLTVNLGDIEAGITKVVTFEVTVNDDAHGLVILNHVKVTGKDGSDGGELEKETDENGGGNLVVDKSESPFIDEINEGDRIITGTGVIGATIKVKIPNRAQTIDTVVGADGTWKVDVPSSVNLLENDEVLAVQIVSDLDPSDPTTGIVQAKKTVIPFMEKKSTNKTSQDDNAHVGDEVEYTITIRNEGSPKSVWTNVKIEDVMPDYVTIDPASVRLDGAVPTFNFYNAANRTLYVTAGDLPGGTEKVLVFTVRINDDAYGQNIINAASVNGKNTDGKEDVKTETEDKGGQNVLEKSEKPEVDDITRGDEKVTGTGKPGAEIEVEFPNGEKETVIVDEDGNWTVDVPDDVELENGDKVNVVQKEKGKDPSDKVEVIVKDKSHRAITGLVYPMISDDLGLGDDFLRKHDIVVELRATYNTPVESGLSTTAVFVGDDQGRFTIENVPFGDYLLYIKKPGYLARCMMITVSPSDADIIELTPPSEEGRFDLWFGDVNDDFVVDNLDIMMVIEYMELQINALSPDYNPACDLNADGMIDNLDIMMIIENFNKNVTHYPGAEDINFFE